VTSSSVLRQTTIGCAILAAGVVVAVSLIGHTGQGLGIGIGLVVGSLNGYLIQGLLRRGAPFVAASLLRLVFFSSLVLIAAFALHGDAWTVALGIGLAQLVMVGVGIRGGLKR
jgi:hypothetical protein